MTAPEASPALPDSPAPVTPAAPARAPLPDVLRGLALWGILVVNLQDFAGYVEWQQRGLDRAAQALTDVIANGRFISIFAMLFGWGAAGLLARRGVGTFLRRHAALLLVGSLHFVFLWHGDIIANYALLAPTLLLLSRLGPGPLVGLAAALGTWWLGLGLLAGLSSLQEGEGRARWTGLPRLEAGQTYSEVVQGRAAEYASNLLGGTLYNGPWLVALFCLGAAAQRSGLLTRPHEHRPLLRGLAVGGLVLGLPLGALLAWMNTRGGEAMGLLAIPVRMSGGLASALGYVGVLGLLAASGRLGPLRHLAASGRLALSHYLTQSLLMTTLFYPYAGAQWGSWGAAAALALSLTVGLAQVAVSGPWLRRFGAGPAERVVHWLVYGPQRRGRPGETL